MKCQKCNSEIIYAQVETTTTHLVIGETDNTILLDENAKHIPQEEVVFICGNCGEILDVATKDIEYQ